MTREEKQAIVERIWFLENEAKAAREEAKRLRAILRKLAA